MKLVVIPKKYSIKSKRKKGIDKIGKTSDIDLKQVFEFLKNEENPIRKDKDDSENKMSTINFIMEL